jgi:hypothetical protein
MVDVLPIRHLRARTIRKSDSSTDQQSGIAGSDAQSHSSALPISLKDLIREAEQNSPEIAVAEHGYTAATHVARQASVLPDAQVNLQQFAVGSPPFAGSARKMPVAVQIPRSPAESLWTLSLRSDLSQTGPSTVITLQKRHLVRRKIDTARCP